MIRFNIVSIDGVLLVFDLSTETQIVCECLHVYSASEQVVLKKFGDDEQKSPCPDLAIYLVCVVYRDSPYTVKIVHYIPLRYPYP